MNAHRITLGAAAVALLAACTAAPVGANAGGETAACIDGECFDGLECLSDLCVAPEGAGTEGEEEDDDSQADSGQNDSGQNDSGQNDSGQNDSGNNDDDDSGPTSDTSEETSGGSDEGDTGSVAGCEKIDYLFVVDNSASTYTFQSQLVDALPDIVASINNRSDNNHIGVITTDDYLNNLAGCNQLGGLVVQTGGPDSSNAACGPYDDGGGYMTSNDNLGQSLSCAMRVGTGGSGSERPMDAMLATTSGALAGAGQCNAGFLRDDSLLVVVIVTDEYDGPDDPNGDGSAGSPATWYNDLLEYRNAPETNVVMGVLTNYEDGSCPPLDITYDGGHMVTFAEMFTHGVVGGICDDFTPFFEDLHDAVGEACENFTP